MKNSTNKDLFVGIDYHQKSVQVCVLDRSGRVLANKSVDNDCGVIAALTARAGHRVRRVALEACNGAADLAEQLIERFGWSVELAHPGYVARMKGSPDKHDLGDAHLLADLTRVGYLPKVWIAPPWVRELRRLVRYRQQQVDQRRNAKLRIGALLRDHRLQVPVKPGMLNAWTQAWHAWLTDEALKQLPDESAWVIERQLVRIEQLQKEIAITEKRLWSFTGEDQLTLRLLDETGVGPITAWVLRAEVGRFDRFNDGKALSRFCGLSPRNASSSQRQADAGLIKASSNLLRATLIELAHRLTRCTPRWRQLKAKLRAAGKPGSVAAAAVANRWVRQLYYRMTDQQQPNRERILAATPC